MLTPCRMRQTTTAQATLAILVNLMVVLGADFGL